MASPFSPRREYVRPPFSTPLTYDSTTPYLSPTLERSFIATTIDLFARALHPPRSDLASQNNYRSRRTNDIFQDNVYERCTMEICMYIFFIQILIYSSTAEAETTLILQYKFTNFVG